jgi:hypothetical protein
MWELLFTALILVVVYTFSIRQQLLFLFGARRKVKGVISQMEPFFEQNEEYPRWSTRCMVEYEVKGSRYKLPILRREQPALGQVVTLTYPSRRPNEAVEGEQRAAIKQRVYAVILSLISILIVVYIKLQV